ncbi:hypothetical protein [Glycomyces sp. NRRL B-16210]|uniref:hypothetical protein n=1 Tax=Glycomyces sp. NRRL B-16210 TaxID=1463821 RepID=UPI0004BF29F0|nr:hypothetical protein [Glycomyces sp. NRRL B-16210]
MVGDERARVRRELRALEERVLELETLAVRALVLLTSTLLIVGSLVPMYAGSEEDRVPALRLGTAGFAILGSLDEAGDARGFAVTMEIVFLILLAGIVVAVGVGYQQWFLIGSRAVVRVAKTTTVVLWSGVAVVLLFTTEAAGDQKLGELGPGLWLYLPGTVLFTLATYRTGLQRLWNRDD